MSQAEKICPSLDFFPTIFIAIDVTLQLCIDLNLGCLNFIPESVSQTGLFPSGSSVPDVLSADLPYCAPMICWSGKNHRNSIELKDLRQNRDLYMTSVFLSWLFSCYKCYLQVVTKQIQIDIEEITILTQILQILHRISRVIFRPVSGLYWRTIWEVRRKHRGTT